jgi:hypothetical protein
MAIGQKVAEIGFEQGYQRMVGKDGKTAGNCSFFPPLKQNPRVRVGKRRQVRQGDLCGRVAVNR